MFKEEDLSLYLEDLKTIVNIESPTNHKDGINAVTKFFENKAKELGFTCIYKEYNKESGSVLIISNAEEDQKLDVLMLAHLDTVYEVGSIKKQPFVINDNKIHGCGVVDNKGGALLGLYALKYLDKDKGKYALLLNTNEEQGSPLNSVLIQEYAKKSTFTLVLEPAREDGSLVEKRYGMISYNIKFKGQKSEDLNFTKGASALVEMSNFIRYVSIINNPYKGMLINTTIVNAPKTKFSEVPDYMELGLQMRFLEMDALDILSKKIAYAKEHKQVKNVEIIEEVIAHSPPLIATAYAKELKKDIWLLGRKNRQTITWQSSFGGSDGCFASEIGASVIDAMGPVGGKFHTVEEYLDKDSILPKGNLLLNTIHKIIEKKETKQNDKS